MQLRDIFQNRQVVLESLPAFGFQKRDQAYL